MPAEFAAALPRDHYAPGVMRLFVRGLLVARAGQRCLAAVLGLLAPLLPGMPEAPCANTGRMWLLRLGLYELTRPKPKADDWVWILDHTVQLGGSFQQTHQGVARLYDIKHKMALLLQAAAAEQLQERLDGLGINPATQAMETATLEFVAEQSAQARPQERLIGSSEVLESLIGKYKHLQGTHSQGGMTPQLLAFGAIVMKNTTETIRDALTAVRTCDVLQWCQEHLGLSVQGQRRYAHQEQNPDTKLLPTPESF